MRIAARGHVRFLDAVTLAVLSALVAVFASAVWGHGNRGASVQIVSAKATEVYPLDVDRTIPVDGPLGTTVVVIENGAARVVDSPCRDKTCMHMGRIDAAGGRIACIPNRVFVRVVSSPPGTAALPGASGGVDATAY
jgi:hypothetical protein